MRSDRYRKSLVRRVFFNQCAAQRELQLMWGLQLDIAQYPVNQRIVAGEPVVSQNYNTSQVERGYIEVQCLNFSGWKLDRHCKCLSDDRY
jgi:hypothetical protein